MSGYGYRPFLQLPELYFRQMWAEAMEIYRSGNFKLKFSPEMAKYLKEHQRDFMPEDTTGSTGA